MSEPVGAVAALWRFPVKSMLGEQVATADLTLSGVVGDRAYALIDSKTGKVVSAKNPKLWPDMFACHAVFVEPPRRGEDTPPVRITFPDATWVTSDEPDVGARLSRFFGREVRLAQAAPEDFTIDQYHPDVEELDPEGHRDTVAESKLGSAFFAEAGLPSAVPVGSFFDLFPVSLLTSSTLDRLNGLRSESRFDARRFRMNVIVATEKEGFLENEWFGRELSIGGDVRLRASIPDPRCVMTTLAQDDLPKDAEVLRTLVQNNRLEVPGAGRYPCAGVYAVAESAGTMQEGDAVSLV